MKGGLKLDRLPFPSADPMQNTFSSLAGKAMELFAPSFEAEARIIMPCLRALFNASTTDNGSSLIPNEIEMISTSFCIHHSIA
jgi:hypothetical protein